MTKEVFAQLVSQMPDQQENVDGQQDELPSQVVSPNTITIIPNQGILLNEETIFIPGTYSPETYDRCDICNCCRISNTSYENFIRTLPNQEMKEVISPWSETQEIIQMTINE